MLRLVASDIYLRSGLINPRFQQNSYVEGPIFTIFANFSRQGIESLTKHCSPPKFEPIVAHTPKHHRVCHLDGSPSFTTSSPLPVQEDEKWLMNMYIFYIVPLPASPASMMEASTRSLTEKWNRGRGTGKDVEMYVLYFLLIYSLWS